MQALYDHITSVFVAGIVVLVLAGVQLSGQESAIDAVRFQANRTQTDGITEMVMQDLSNLGAGVAAGSARIHTHTGTAPTTTFEFSGAVAPNANAAVQRIRYTLVPTGTVTIRLGGTARAVPSYELRRSEVGVDSYTWSTPQTLTDFGITLLRADGTQVTSDLASARTAVVRFSAISSLGNDGAVGVTRWERRIPLQNMLG